ncbi:MAG: ligase-associated DNA damage response exonuclease [Hyphomicrobiales bacterium]
MKNEGNLIEPTEAGLLCPAGHFFIDPRSPVERAVITHAHADHARPGCSRYLATPECARLLKARLGSDLAVQVLPYGEGLSLDGVRLSLHSAGHILGSAQVRLERNGEVWVVTGDFKRHPDPTCRPFEPLRCHTLVTESTFGLPVFNWPDPPEVVADINAWWRKNKDQGLTSILFAYALGKAQRVAAEVDPGIGPILTHEAVEHMAAVYRQAGVQLNPTMPVPGIRNKDDFAGALIIAPPSADGSPGIGTFAPSSRAFASGWMQIRGNRRRRALDRGFVLSDHADWKGLLDTIFASGAERVRVMHGFTAEVVRFLHEKGVAAEALGAVFP